MKTLEIISGVGVFLCAYFLLAFLMGYMIASGFTVSQASLPKFARLIKYTGITLVILVLVFISIQFAK